MTIGWKTVVLCVAFTTLLSAVVVMRSQRNAALARAEKAEREAATLMDERDRLNTALSAQEKLITEAQSKRKVVYKTVQKEVLKDATARDWYGTAIPAGFASLLKGSAKVD